MCCARQIWELAGGAQSASVTADQFAIMMHLVQVARSGRELPDTLPQSLRGSPAAGPTAASTPTAAPSGGTWVVSAAERTAYDQYFSTLDTDKDGLVTAAEAVTVFRLSGLSQEDMAKVWRLCDTQACGKINADEFALAMHLLSARVRLQRAIPDALTADMVPPSRRAESSRAALVGSTAVAADAMNAARPSLAVTIMANAPAMPDGEDGTARDLRQLADKVDSVSRERSSLAAETSELEHKVAMRKQELRDWGQKLQTANDELAEAKKAHDAAAATLSDFEQQLAAVRKTYLETQGQQQQHTVEIERLRARIDEQNRLIRSREEELARMRADLERTTQEEKRLAEEGQQCDTQSNSLQQQIAAVKAERDKVVERIAQTRGKIDEVAKNPPTEAEAETLEDAGATKTAQVSKEALWEIADPFHAPPEAAAAVAKTAADEDPFKEDAFADASVGLPDPFKVSDERMDPFGTGAGAAPSPVPSSSSSAVSIAKPAAPRSPATAAAVIAPQSGAHDPFGAPTGADNKSASAPMSDPFGAPVSTPAVPASSPFDSADPFAPAFGATRTPASAAAGTPAAPASSSFDSADPFAAVFGAAHTPAGTAATGLGASASSKSSGVVADASDPWAAFVENRSGGSSAPPQAPATAGAAAADPWGVFSEPTKTANANDPTPSTLPADLFASVVGTGAPSHAANVDPFIASFDTVPGPFPASSRPSDPFAFSNGAGGTGSRGDSLAVDAASAARSAISPSVVQHMQGTTGVRIVCVRARHGLCISRGPHATQRHRLHGRRATRTIRARPCEMIFRTRRT